MAFQSSQVPLGEALPTLHSSFHLFVHCVCVFTHVPWCAGGGQRAVCRGHFSPLPCGSWELKHFYLPSPLTGTVDKILKNALKRKEKKSAFSVLLGLLFFPVLKK